MFQCSSNLSKAESWNFLRQGSGFTKNEVFFFFFPVVCESTEHLLRAIGFGHSHVHSPLPDNAVRWKLPAPSKRNWASERVSSVFKVAYLVSGGAGNPTVSSFLSYTSNCLFIVLTGTQLRRYSHAQPLQCETKHIITRTWMKVDHSGIMYIY